MERSGSILVLVLVTMVLLTAGCTEKKEELEEEGNGEEDDNNVKPHAAFWFPRSGFVGQSIKFDGSNSTDSDGEIVEYYWEFGDTDNATGEIVYHTYEFASYLRVMLRVTDNNGSYDTDYDYINIDDIEVNETDQEPPAIELECRKIGVVPNNAKYVVSIINVTGNNTDIMYFGYMITDQEDGSILDNNTVLNAWNNISSGVVFASVDGYMSAGDRFTISQEDIPGLEDGDLFSLIYIPKGAVVGECELTDT